MSQTDYRVAIVLDGEIPVNSVVIADGFEGDKTLASNPLWVEVTGMNPMPGVDAGWSYVKGKWVAPAVPQPTVEDVEQARARAYRESSDPLFFQYQRGEVTEQAWLDAVQAVKNAHPYPEV
jgi:hypothetical protein